MGATNAAVRHIQRCIYLLQLAAPSLHPEITSTLLKLGIIYLESGATPLALKALWEASQRALAGGSLALFASVASHMALAYGEIGLYREAANWARKCVSVSERGEGAGGGGVAETAASPARALLRLYIQRSIDFEAAEAAVGKARR